MGGVGLKECSTAEQVSEFIEKRMLSSGRGPECYMVIEGHVKQIEAVETVSRIKIT